LRAGELLRQHGLSPEARRTQLVLADAAGLVWIVGIRRGNRLAVSDAGEGAWLVHAAAAVRPER
jgi:hypothetical protein